MMIVKILLGVLYLSGWLVLSKCRQYHFVNESFTWYEAQSYCRKNYTDLACIENSEEMNQLINTVSSAGYNSEVWIGVYIHLDWYHGSHISDDVWNWENQTGNEPFLVSYFCQSVSVSGLQLHYNDCLMEHPFICYNGGYNRSEYVLVNERMDWFRALRYCRKNFTDIANYWCPDTELKLELNGDQIWTGFIGLPHIYFSDRTNSSFSYWDNFENIFGISGALYGAADLQRSGKWRLLPSNTKLPFVCYDNLPAPGKEIGHKKVIKMNLKQEDSSMDLNDEAVKANFLKKLQESLKQKGLNGVTLEWREQPDGVVIHKEKKKTQKKEMKRTEL